MIRRLREAGAGGASEDGEKRVDLRYVLGHRALPVD